MKLVKRYNFLACLTALLAALAYCTADEATGVLALLSITAFGVAVYTGRGERPWALPRWFINLLMLAAIVDAIFKVVSNRTFSGFWIGAANMPIVSTLSQFLVYILLAKLFDRRTARDEAHLLSLSIFVVVGAVLTSNSLVVGLFVLAFAPCIICTAMLLQLVGGARAIEDWARASHIPVESVPAPGGPTPRRFRRDFAWSASLAVLGTIALASFSFVLMPRGLWKDVLGGFGKVADGAAVGFTDQIRLGTDGLLRNQADQSPVLSVRLTSTVGDKDRDLGQMSTALYLRGTVKTRYVRSTRTWESDSYEPLPRRSPILDVSRNDDLSEVRGERPRGSITYQTKEGQSLRLGDERRGQIVIRQEYTLQRPLKQSGYFFTILRPIEFLTNQDAAVYPPASDMVLRSGGASRELKGYTVISALEYADDREPERDDVAFDSPVIRSITERILTERGISLDPAVRDAAGNRRAANAFMDYLRTTCTYSLQMTAPEANEDAIEMFLTRTRTGHCEYFASAMVVMCHSVGLDARLVAGYLATEFNRLTGEYIVRESNAHAWTEVRISPGRWQTFDPSPPDAVNRTPRGVLARLRQWYDALNLTWSSAVISFDVSKQERLIGSPRGWGEIMGTVGETLTDLRRGAGGAVGILRLVLFGALASVLLFMVIRAWQRRRSGRRTSPALLAPEAHDPVLAGLLQQAGFYGEALELLSKSELAKPTHRPPGLHAQRLDPTLPPAAAALASITELYYRIRFGRLPLSETELAQARQTLDLLAATLREHDAARLEAARRAGLTPG